MQDGRDWIMLAASDSVSELVWSQTKGLSLKSVECSKSDKKPLILWNIWDNTAPLSPSRSVESCSSDDKQISERNFITSNENPYVDGIPCYNDTAREIIGPSHIPSAENSLKMDNENSNDGDLPSQKGQIDENVGDFDDKEVCSAVNLGGKEESKFDKVMTETLNIGTSRNATRKICENFDGGGDKSRQQFPCLNTLESSAENDHRNDNPPSEERVARGSSVPVETSSIMKKSRWKGQKKAVSDGNLDGGRLVDAARDESQKSEESCNSVGFLSTKVKRKCEFQDNLMAESKRIKKQVHGIPASTSVKRHDSSFRNWIINVAKGGGSSSSKANQECAPPPLELRLQLGHPNSSLLKKNIGFRNVFKSLYSSSAMFTEARTAAATDGSKEHGVINLIHSPELFTEKCGDLNKVSVECIPSSHVDSAANNLEVDLEENKVRCISNESPNPVIPAGEIVENKSTLVSSLWITRLSTQIVSSRVPKYPCDAMMVHTLPEANRKSVGGSSYRELQLIASKDETACNAIEEIYGHDQNALLDQNRNTLLPTAENFGKPEATAFMFPRKLDALKCLVPSPSKDHGTCFFCGKRRESFACCSHLNEAEQHEESSRRYHYSCNGEEEVPKHVLPVTSIRCIESNHLDVSCQIEGSSGLKNLEKNVCQCAGQTFKKEHLAYGKEVVTSARSPDSTGTEKPQMNIGKKSLIFHQFLPVAVNDPQVVDLPKEIFKAVRRLQVSRADMLKLMNSQLLLSHIEGFFLRLRLGKWEAGLGGTGYHVACITGKSINDGQNCLYVDVGGIKCPVGSQYVSNQEFSEEELKTWWCRSMRSGGMIPKIDDLELKFNQRIKLGF